MTMITVIAASTRAGANSRNVADYLARVLKEKGCKSEVLDLHEHMLPLYDTTIPEHIAPTVAHIRSLLEKSTGFIFVSPEWDGMFSAGLHNLFHYIDKEMANKPVVLVGVSTGRGGRYPLLQMRTMGYKNRGFVVLPESLFFDGIETSLVDGAFVDSRNTERAGYVLDVLITYAEALTTVRKSGVINYRAFPDGL